MDPPAKPGGRVVILDDAPLECTIFARCAARAGWTVAGEAGAAADAVALVRLTKPDLVVLDGRLPPDGAVALLPSLRAEHPGLPILIVAAPGEVALVRAALASGASGVLARPLLAAAVGEQLRRVARTLAARRE